MPALRGPRSIRRRQPIFVLAFLASRAKSMPAEMYGAPSSPCCRWTGSVVRSASLPVSTTWCTGACGEGTSMGATGRASRSRSTLGKPAIIELYRLRWIIEEFFHTLKTAGFDIEAADIGNPHVMIKFVTAATVAAITVMQLVKARDGTTGQDLAEVFDPADQPILEAISVELEGKTLRQKNPHPKGTLGFAAWVIGHLGGWTGYYGKPGPKVMRRGLEDFRRIKFGTMLKLQNV